MCGINGIIYKNSTANIASVLQIMNQRIIHRGPDDEGIYTFEKRIAMGMRRLSVIDLSTGHQPMHSDNEKLTIVFNGEIYNYKSLREHLENKNVVFKTHSDTEVVLQLYSMYGVSCLDHLNGMFAIAIHDSDKNRVFLARDRFGEKPLYYHWDNEKIVWASELKSIIDVFPSLKKIDQQSLLLFLALTYIPAPHTIYRNIYKLLPGHYMLIDTETLGRDIGSYWNVPLSADENVPFDYKAAKSKLRQTLFESVEQRMVADVPLGVFLSGGVDSTIIAAIMASISSSKIKAFTVGYDNQAYDESARASIVASYIGAEHYIFPLQYSNMLEKLDAVILNYDEPFADSSALPTYFIASKAANEVTVALTGDGGDEVFGGYNKYQSLRYQRIIQQWLPASLRKKITNPLFLERTLGNGETKSIRSKAKRFLSSLESDTKENHLNIIALGFRQAELNRLLISEEGSYKKTLFEDLGRVDYTALTGLKLLRYIDAQVSLEGDMLVKVDRASMLCSLECRAPLLDHRLIEETYAWPDNFLIKGSNKKRILKETFADLLPKGFFNSPKSGFEIPVGLWLRNELKNDLVSVLSPENLQAQKLFNTTYVQQLLNEHLSMKLNHSWKLWTLYCFQKWYKHNFN